jgi:hypothetical protein
VKTVTIRPNDKPWFNSSIQKSMRLRDRLHKQLKRKYSVSLLGKKNVFRRLALSSSFTTNSPVASFCKGGIGDEVDLTIDFFKQDSNMT